LAAFGGKPDIEPTLLKPSRTWVVAYHCADVVADWKNTPGTVGIRIILTKEAKREPNDTGLDRILGAAVRHDFPVNILCWGNLDAGTALIDRHPDTRFIIDHLGMMQPRMPPALPQPWADLPKVLELARRPNAVIKVSGACTLSREPYPFPDIWDPLARVFDAWGFDRCLWARTGHARSQSSTTSRPSSPSLRLAA
jgi:predicted TIM-barrel fold metal-dependent hydrolase